VLILVPPLVVAVYEVFHPNPDVTAAAVMDVAGWFALFHAIQLVLFVFLVLSIALLAQNLGVLEHWATRLGLVLVLVFFSAYDAIAGIATGLAMRAARDLRVAEQNAVFEVVKDWPGFDPSVFAIGVVAILGLVLALAMLTVGARRQVGRGPVILLALATIAALGGHPFPFGTVAFGCLFLAALWLDRLGVGQSGRPAPA
jgi:cytochrome bd-type quinol oxidase subunit 2